MKDVTRTRPDDHHTVSEAVLYKTLDLRHWATFMFSVRSYRLNYINKL
jgi:hypothetical protein